MTADCRAVLRLRSSSCLGERLPVTPELSWSRSHLGSRRDCHSLTCQVPLCVFFWLHRSPSYSFPTLPTAPTGVSCVSCGVMSPVGCALRRAGARCRSLLQPSTQQSAGKWDTLNKYLWGELQCLDCFSFFSFFFLVFF